MKPPMLYTAYKLAYTRNSYGDYVTAAETELVCHYRYIINHISDTNNEIEQSDAMAWFEPNSGVELKDIIRIEDNHFRVEKITEGKTFRTNNVQFLKVELQTYGVIS